jgi:hypothetical protein
MARGACMQCVCCGLPVQTLLGAGFARPARTPQYRLMRCGSSWSACAARELRLSGKAPKSEQPPRQQPVQVTASAGGRDVRQSCTTKAVPPLRPGSDAALAPWRSRTGSQRRHGPLHRRGSWTSSISRRLSRPTGDLRGYPPFHPHMMPSCGCMPMRPRHAWVHNRRSARSHFTVTACHLRILALGTAKGLSSNTVTERLPEEPGVDRRSCPSAPSLLSVRMTVRGGSSKRLWSETRALLVPIGPVADMRVPHREVDVLGRRREGWIRAAATTGRRHPRASRDRAATGRRP